MNKTKKKCGAKTRSGGTCKRWAMPNGRCKLHGGMSTGPGKANKNALVHGAYSARFLPGEEARFRPLIGTLEDELTILRAQMDRALEAQMKQIQNPDDIEGLEITEGRLKEDMVEAGEDGKAVTKSEQTTVKTRPDLRLLIDRLAQRIANLERIRADLIVMRADDLLDRVKAAVSRTSTGVEEP